MFVIGHVAKLSFVYLFPNFNYSNDKCAYSKMSKLYHLNYTVLRFVLRLIEEMFISHHRLHYCGTMIGGHVVWFINKHFNWLLLWRIFVLVGGGVTCPCKIIMEMHPYEGSSSSHVCSNDFIHCLTHRVLSKRANGLIVTNLRDARDDTWAITNMARKKMMNVTW